MTEKGTTRFRELTYAATGSRRVYGAPLTETMQLRKGGDEEYVDGAVVVEVTDENP
ncbi:hypothetical protein [Haloprofundus halophilus]|uniref:hypothetical protein n=1 Tax=Haloprofundus halophilus TaxID=2283527 RepID=UPI0013006B2E|nr:hypothetical protein [Haloprofundus halophilus]